MTRGSQFRAVVLAVGLAAFLGGAAAADVAKWDQAAVTALGKQLAAAGSNWWDAMVHNQPGDFVGSGDAYDNFTMQQKSRRVQEQSQALAGQLADGKSYKDTKYEFLSLKELVDDTDVMYARDEVIDPTEESWGKFSKLFHQIEPYYLPNAR